MSDYAKTTWVEGGAPGISAAQLNRMEDGIDTAHSELDAHLNDATAAHPASAISVAPAGSIASTDVQAALQELDAEKLPVGGKAADSDKLDGLHASDFATNNLQVFTASGNFVVPAGVTRLFVEVVGGGGGGGSANTQGECGGGGGGGGYAARLITGLVPGTSIPVTVGAGGGSNGTGGTSSFGAYVSASGGAGGGQGGSSESGQGGLGGTGSQGDINIDGDDGGLGMPNALDADLAYGGHGGASVYGGGGRGRGAHATGTDGMGDPGGKYGGGAGGSLRLYSTSYAGAAGGQGVVIVRW